MAALVRGGEGIVVGQRLRTIDQAQRVGVEAGFGDADDFPVFSELLRQTEADCRRAQAIWRPKPMRIAATSLDGVIGLVRIPPKRRTPKLIAIAAIERAVEGDRPIAQRTILNRGLQVVPQAAETRRLGRRSLGGLGGREVGGFRGAADRPGDQHGANQFLHGSRPSSRSLLELSSVMNHESFRYVQWNIWRPDSKDDRSVKSSTLFAAPKRACLIVVARARQTIFLASRDRARVGNKHRENFCFLDLPTAQKSRSLAGRPKRGR
jgi:hypothetical protein